MKSANATQPAGTDKAPAADQGLTDEEARVRLQQYDYNELPSRQRRTVLRIVGEGMHHVTT